MTSKKDNFNPDEPGIIAHSQVQVLACVPFVRPRSLVRHLARHLARRPNFRDVARLTKQVLVSAGFIAGGLLAGQIRRESQAIDQYRIKTDKRSGITNDPNRDDDEEYILRLVGQVITVSLQTVHIVQGLPVIDNES